MLIYNVFGRHIGVQRQGERWRVFRVDINERKFSPLAGVIIPDDLTEAEIPGWLGVLQHHAITIVVVKGFTVHIPVRIKRADRHKLRSARFYIVLAIRQGDTTIPTFWPFRTSVATKRDFFINTFFNA